MILNDEWNYLYLLQQIKDRERFLVKFVIDNGGIYGLSIFSGVAYIKEVGISSPYNDSATYTIQLQGSGEYSLSGTVVTPSGTVIIAGTAIEAVQRTATEGQTIFTLPGYVGMTLVYASRGSAVIAPIGSAGDYNSGITWDPLTATATLYTPAVADESFIFLIQ